VLYLPRSEAAVEVADPDSGEHPTQGHETLLLVEDQEHLRRTLSELLAEYGYVVHAAGDPETALALVAEHGDAIQLLITDVVLPRMNGRELAEKVLARRPGLPVLFVSGYSPDETLRKAAEERTVAFLQKPFTAEEMAATIRTLLGS